MLRAAQDADEAVGTPEGEVAAHGAGNPVCPTFALELSRAGSLIIVDHTVRDGEVVDPDGPEGRAVRGATARAALPQPGTTETPYDQPFHAASRLYRADVDPERDATVVVGNDDPRAPVLREIWSTVRRQVP